MRFCLAPVHVRGGAFQMLLLLLLVVERIPFSMCWCFSVCETLRGFGLGILVMLWVGPPCFWCFSVAGFAVAVVSWG
jgi:hypothetical protein